MNNKQSYKHTGKNVSVSREDLVQSVRSKLAEYDVLSPEQKTKKANPYVDPVYAKTADGKTVQVPRYLQNAVIVKWRTTRGTAHTRLDNSTRYAFKDPYIMNKDIKGAMNDIDREDCGMTIRDLDEHQKFIAQKRSEVGSRQVPDVRYGMGGSAGDLPRDYYINEGADIEYHRKMKQNALHTKGYDHSDEIIDDYDSFYASPATRSMKTSPQKKKQLEGPAAYAENSDEHGMIGIDDEVVLDEGSIEQYASVGDGDDEECGNREHIYDQNAKKCKPCNMGDNRVIQRGKRDDNSGYEYDDRYENDAYDVDVSEGSGDIVENMDGCEYDNTYKYLFFILLLIVLFLGYNYKKNKGTGLF